MSLHYRREWRNALRQGKFEDYMLGLTQAFLAPMSCDALTKTLQQFETVEKEFGQLQNPALAPIYAEFFAIFRDRQFLPLIQRQEFSYELFRLIPLLDGLPLQSNPQADAALDRLRKSWPTEKGQGKFVVAAVILLLEMLGGVPLEQARVHFLRRFTDITTHYVIQRQQDVDWFGDLCRLIFRDMDEALDLFAEHVYDEGFWDKDIVTQKSNFIWAIQVLWNVYGAETNWLRIYPKWLEMFGRAMREDRRELVFYLHYPLSHMYFNLTHTQDQWKQFNDDVEMPLSEYIQRIAHDEPDLAPVTREYDPEKRPLKIAFVYDRIVMNSPFKVLYSLLKALQEHNEGEYEFAVYDLEYMEKSRSDPNAVKMIRDLGVEYTSNHALSADMNAGFYYSHYDKSLALRKRIVQDEIDVLIMGNNREQFNLLFSARSAPRQLYWSHGSGVYDVLGIDRRVSHIDLSQYGHEFEGFKVPMDAETFYNPPRDPAIIAKERAKYPKDAFILGTIGRLIKLESDEYLETVAEIMKRHPHTVYIAAGAGGAEKIKKKVRELGIADRFYFPGFVDAHVYGHIIDLWLDTFPLHQGESRVEYYNKSKPFIRNMSVMTKAEFIEARVKDKFSGFSRYIKQSKDAAVDVQQIPMLGYDIPSVAYGRADYIKKASTLISDKRLRSICIVWQDYKSFEKRNLLSSQGLIEKLIGGAV